MGRGISSFRYVEDSATRSCSSSLTQRRYIQSSKHYNSPLSASASAVSVSSSSSSHKDEDHDGIGIGIGTGGGDGSSSNNKVARNASKDGVDEDILSLSNASIQRLLEEELRAYDNIRSEVESISKAATNMKHRKENIELEPSAELNLDGSPAGAVTGTRMDHSLDLNAEITNHHDIPQPTMVELLKSFDPINPPPHDASPEDVQLWLECSAQQESVEKYEAIVNSARDREDFTSMGTVQRQLLSWYNPLRTKILTLQEEYFSKERKNKGANRYGPFLCALQPEKLAIITTHEATMVALKKGGGGATLMSMAMKIGEAVEAEVNVQKLLRRRMMQNRRDNADFKANKDDESIASNNNVSVSVPEAVAAQEEEKADKFSSDKKENDIDWMYRPAHLQRFVEELNRLDPSRKGKVRIARANRRAMQLLESTEPWTSADKVVLGAVLIQMLLDTARVSIGNNNFTPGNLEEMHSGNNKYGQPAFTYEQKWKGINKLVGHVVMNEDFYQMVVNDKFSSLDNSTTRHKPMVIPPKEWVSPTEGGYSVLKTEFMRTHGCEVQRNALREADLSTIMDGLNVLGKVPWKINKEIMSLALTCWNDGITLGDIPSREDFYLPPHPVRPDGNSSDYKEGEGEFRRYREALIKYRRINQKNLDLRSRRGSALLKLNQSEQFKDFQKIYFPYNIDFRGRAYPVPPHLSNIGSDLCRGMLTFAESKPLGPKGLYWLKVHLANLAGNDKITFDQRADFTEKNMENVRACAEDPLENRWWMGLDDPFQGLAACHEIVKAIDSGNPEEYECSLPVHMDGSCNGLQHYAALGRDRVGGKAVNLCNYDTPQDVYSGVMEEVIKRVADEAERIIDIDATRDDLTKKEKEALTDHRAAVLTNGLIDRGVVKRTVMTSVYGVTYIGAKKQIQEKIEEKLEAKGYDIDEMDTEIYSACGYLARITMDVMGDLFSGARQTMNWLATCARLISSQGQPVAWISPIGVPAVQPYRQRQPYTVVTLLQTVVLINDNANLPVHKQRQASAFPPNYVHSLDSSHMLLTALEMDRRGLTFSAVHDSFWTHACDIDEMNGVLRECFVDLYTRPLLEELKKTWELQYPSLEFPDLPETGDMDLDEVKHAPYFFQ